jgi:hypothetical protein
MSDMQPLPLTPRLRVTRIAERQVTDRQVLHDILDAGLVAHLALVRDGLPVVLPLGYARDGDTLLLHGSTGGGLLRAVADGAPLAVTVTLLDGLVFARTLFDSSMNYRSAMICGRATVLQGREKEEGLRRLSEHLMPGRWDETRPPNSRELAATLVARLALAEASVKVRDGQATTGPDEESRDVWAGVLPLGVQAGAPRTNDGIPPHVAVPSSVRAAARRHSTSAPPTPPPPAQ